MLSMFDGVEGVLRTISLSSSEEFGIPCLSQHGRGLIARIKDILRLAGEESLAWEISC